MLALAALLLVPGRARAHDPGLSALELREEGQEVEGWLGLATVDAERLLPVDADRDGSLSPAELAAARTALEELARKALEVEVNGRPVRLRRIGAEADPTGGVRLRFAFAAAPGARVQVRSLVLGRLPRGHREYVSVRDTDGALVAERMLGPGADAVSFSPTNANSAGEAEGGAPGRGSTFRRFAVLGLEHIFTGYDHLAFLLGLLIAGASLRAAAKVISSFTLAHSLTLALATFDIVHLPARLTEPLIAASIVYVGLENVLRRAPAKRWLLTFGFGLVHGFGFATVLRDLGIGCSGAGAAVPLFSFNLGVELGQLSIAMVALPLFWTLYRRPSLAARAAPAASLAVAALGGFWLLQRTLLA